MNKGVTLLRAAAKNHERVTVITNPNDYDKVIGEMEKNAGGEYFRVDVLRLLLMFLFLFLLLLM